MKILFFADLHICNQTTIIKNILKDNDYDLIISLGDNLEYDLENILKFKKDVPFYGVLGNHNNLTDYENYKEIKNIHYNIVPFQGLKFLGFEGCMRYKETNAPMWTDDQVIRLMGRMPYVDIFVSHTGPSGVMTDVDEDDVSRLGFKGFNEYLMRTAPKYHFFGHYHTNKELSHWSGTKLYSVFGITLFDTEKDEMKVLYTEEE